MYCGSKHCEKVDFASCCVTYALISALYSHFSLTTLTDGAHGRGKAESQVCLWAVATTHGSGRRAPLWRLALIITVFRTNYHMKKNMIVRGQSGGSCDSYRCARLGQGQTCFGMCCRVASLCLQRWSIQLDTFTICMQHAGMFMIAC